MRPREAWCHSTSVFFENFSSGRLLNCLTQNGLRGAKRKESSQLPQAGDVRARRVRKKKRDTKCTRNHSNMFRMGMSDGERRNVSAMALVCPLHGRLKIGSIAHPAAPRKRTGFVEQRCKRTHCGAAAATEFQPRGSFQKISRGEERGHTRVFSSESGSGISRLLRYKRQKHRNENLAPSILQTLRPARG